MKLINAMKKILTPTDFSSCALRASETAIALAKVANAQIHFLHLFSIPANWLYQEGYQDKMYTDVSEKVALANKKLEQLVALAQKQNVDATFQVDFNDDKKTINKYIKNHNIDIIVMGSHGADGMKELLVGTNAQKVIRSASVPVLIVKENNASVLVPEIVFVSDFEAEAMKPFQKVIGIAELLKARVHLLYINTPAFFNDNMSIENSMETFVALASERLAKASIYSDFLFEDGIQHYCDKYDIGLVAIATHSRRGFSRMLIGSDAERVINHLTTPVLSLHF
jgi:nucleotide-binding universal stress UspA family protein